MIRTEKKIQHLRNLKQIQHQQIQHQQMQHREMQRQEMQHRETQYPQEFRMYSQIHKTVSII